MVASTTTTIFSNSFSKIIMNTELHNSNYPYLFYCPNHNIPNVEGNNSTMRSTNGTENKWRNREKLVQVLVQSKYCKMSVLKINSPTSPIIEKNY